MTISLSVHRIIDAIYAHAALEAARRGGETPAMLTRSHRKALARVVLEQTGRVLSLMGSTVTSTTLDEAMSHSETADIITVECAVGQHDGTVACLHTNIEAAIAAGVLAQAGMGTECEQWYEAIRYAADSALPGRIERA